MWVCLHTQIFAVHCHRALQARCRAEWWIADIRFVYIYICGNPFAYSSILHIIIRTLPSCAHFNQCQLWAKQPPLWSWLLSHNSHYTSKLFHNRNFVIRQCIEIIYSLTKNYVYNIFKREVLSPRVSGGGRVSYSNTQQGHDKRRHELVTYNWIYFRPTNGRVCSI